MRTFLAVAVPPEVTRRLYDLRTPLRDHWEGVRWTAPESYHITLVFFGEQDESSIERLISAADGVLPDFPAFNLRLNGAEGFGRSSSPRVFIERVEFGREGISKLRAALQPVLEPLTGWEERAFQPHLTLGRPGRKGARGPEGGGLLPPGVKMDNVGVFRAAEVVLYQSLLSPEGSRYTRLCTWPLKETS